MVVRRVLQWVLVAALLCATGWFLSLSADKVDSFWAWMNPGAKALAEVAPIGTFVAVGTASFLAYRTLRYRARVDDADQWWKRVQYGIGLTHGTASENSTGSKILFSLLGPWAELKDTEEKSREHKRIARIAKKYGWRVSEAEKTMLQEILDESLTGVVPESLNDAELADLERQRKAILTTKEASAGTSGRHLDTSEGLKLPIISRRTIEGREEEHDG